MGVNRMHTAFFRRNSKQVFLRCWDRFFSVSDTIELAVCRLFLCVIRSPISTSQSVIILHNIHKSRNGNSTFTFQIKISNAELTSSNYWIQKSTRICHASNLYLVASVCRLSRTVVSGNKVSCQKIQTCAEMKEGAIKKKFFSVCRLRVAA